MNMNTSSRNRAAEDKAPSSSTSRVERQAPQHHNTTTTEREMVPLNGKTKKKKEDETGESSSPLPQKKKVSVTRFINGKKTKVEVDAEELEEKEQAYKESKKKKSQKFVSSTTKQRPSLSLVPVRDDALVRGLSRLKDLIDDDDDDSGDSDDSDHDNDNDNHAPPSSPQRRRISKKFHYTLPAFRKQAAVVDDDSDISDDDDDDDNNHRHETLLEKRHEEDDDDKAGTGQSLKSKNKHDSNSKSKSTSNRPKTDKHFHYTLPAFEKGGGGGRGSGRGGGDEDEPEESIRLEDDDDLDKDDDDEGNGNKTRSTQLFYGKSLSALGMDQATTQRKEAFSLDNVLNSSAYYGNGNGSMGAAGGGLHDNSLRNSFDGDQSVSSAFFHQEEHAPVKSGIVPIQDIQISVVTGTLSPAMQDKVKNRKKQKDLEKLKSSSSSNNKKSSSSSSKIVPGARTGKTSSSSRKSSAVKSTAAPLLLLSPSGKRKSFTVEAYSTQKKASDQKAAAEEAKEKAAVVEAQKKKVRELEKKLAKMEKEKQKQLKELRVEHEAHIKQLDRDHKAQLRAANPKFDSKDSDETKAAKIADSTLQYLTKEHDSLTEQHNFMKQTLAMAVEQRKILDRQASQLQTKQSSLEQWVERKTRYKEKKEKARRDCITTYIPNHKEELQEANKYCKAEYKIKKLYKSMMEQMVAAVNEQSKDRALAKEIRHLSKDCKKDVKALDKAPLPDDELKAWLEF